MLLLDTVTPRYEILESCCKIQRKREKKERAIERVDDIINKYDLNSRCAFYFQNWLERG